MQEVEDFLLQLLVLLLVARVSVGHWNRAIRSEDGQAIDKNAILGRACFYADAADLGEGNRSRRDLDQTAARPGGLLGCDVEDNDFFAPEEHDEEEKEAVEEETSRIVLHSHAKGDERRHAEEEDRYPDAAIEQDQLLVCLADDVHDGTMAWNGASISSSLVSWDI